MDKNNVHCTYDISEKRLIKDVHKYVRMQETNRKLF